MEDADRRGEVCFPLETVTQSVGDRFAMKKGKTTERKRDFGKGEKIKGGN